MKQLICAGIVLFSILIFSSDLQGQTYSVTFRVDMSQETVSSNGVHIAGNFQSQAGLGSDWDPASTGLADPDGDQIYQVTVDAIPQGVYQYKFVNGNEWSGGENPPEGCTVGDYNNRQVAVYQDKQLPAVVFDSCNAQIRFAVNMSQQEVSDQGVHVMGDFQKAAGYNQNWDPASLQMQDINEDGTYELQLSVRPGDYQYIYVNGTTQEDAEVPPQECSVEGPNNARVRPITADQSNQEPPVYCFNTCQVCDPAISEDYSTYWWNEAVFYEIFVRSFNDSDGDGIGDFQGIIEKLDYLNDGDSTTHSDLGIDGIWLMPMMASPSYHGYDVTNYYATNPDYGSMTDFERFLQEAHKRGIKVIIDFVMNHTSDQHPWFTQSARGENGYRPWYTWLDDDPGSGKWHYRNGAWYFGWFWSGMPDLNYRHTPVKDKMFDVANFWLDKGVDGFRLDAISLLVEDSLGNSQTQQTLSVLEDFHQVYKSVNPQAFTVGEVWSATPEIIPYVRGQRLDACFEFGLASAIVNGVQNRQPSAIENKMERIVGEYPRLQYSPFLSNHDQDRVFSQLERQPALMKQAASVYLTLPGVPFIYYGEEVGMTGTGDHINIRRPMQWTGDTYAGFSSADPWNGVGDNYTTHNVQNMQEDSASLLNHYKRLIDIRQNHTPLQKGYYLDVSSASNQMLSFARIYKGKAVMMLSNFAPDSATANLSLEYSSLPPGTYYLKDLLRNHSMGTLTINEKGGFDTWNLTQPLAPSESCILLISASTPDDIQPAPSASELQVEAYPNPAGPQVQIRLKKDLPGSKSIQVFNLMGKAIYHNRFRGKQTHVATGSWPSGVYLVRITQGTRTGYLRLVVK